MTPYSTRQSPNKDCPVTVFVDLVSLTSIPTAGFKNIQLRHIRFKALILLTIIQYFYGRCRLPKWQTAVLLKLESNVVCHLPQQLFSQCAIFYHNEFCNLSSQLILATNCLHKKTSLKLFTKNLVDAGYVVAYFEKLKICSLYLNMFCVEVRSAVNWAG
jgi:hypothetical protein